MTDREFALLMRRAWGFLAYVTTTTTALLAVLYASGAVDLSPTTGSGMGVLALFAVASAGCWVHWRGETGGEKP